MKTNWKSVLLSAAVLGYATNACALNEDNSVVINSSNNYLPYLQFGGTKFFNVNTAKAALGADFFVPIWQQLSHVVFTHLRLFDRTGKAFEGNAHVGYRHLVPEKEHMYGIYGAFDRKRSDFGNFYNQVTFGAECWLDKFFVGGNYYQPINGKSQFIGVSSEAGSFDRVQSNIWMTRDRQYEKAMNGGDAEVGYELVGGLVGYVGGYYFGAKDVTSIYGPKARITYDWSLNDGKRILGVFDKVGLDCGVQRDRPRGTTYYLNANIRVGLLPDRENKLHGVARHMIDLVRRDVDIVTQDHKAIEGEVYKNSQGKTLTVKEHLGNSNGEIGEEHIASTLADDTVDVVSVKGHVASLSNDVLDGVNGEKVIIFGNNLQLVSPVTQQVVTVDMSHPSSADGGTISANALSTLTNENNSGTGVLVMMDHKANAEMADHLAKKRKMSSLSVEDAKIGNVVLHLQGAKRKNRATITSGNQNEILQISHEQQHEPIVINDSIENKKDVVENIEPKVVVNEDIKPEVQKVASINVKLDNSHAYVDPFVNLPVNVNIDGEQTNHEKLMMDSGRQKKNVSADIETAEETTFSAFAGYAKRLWNTLSDITKTTSPTYGKTRAAVTQETVENEKSTVGEKSALFTTLSPTYQGSITGAANDISVASGSVSPQYGSGVTVDMSGAANKLSPQYNTADINIPDVSYIAGVTKYLSPTYGKARAAVTQEAVANEKSTIVDKSALLTTLSPTYQGSVTGAANDISVAAGSVSPQYGSGVTVDMSGAASKLSPQYKTADINVPDVSYIAGAAKYLSPNYGKTRAAVTQETVENEKSTVGDKSALFTTLSPTYQGSITGAANDISVAAGSVSPQYGSGVTIDLSGAANVAHNVISTASPQYNLQASDLVPAKLSIISVTDGLTGLGHLAKYLSPQYGVITKDNIGTNLTDAVNAVSKVAGTSSPQYGNSVSNARSFVPQEATTDSDTAERIIATENVTSSNWVGEKFAKAAQRVSDVVTKPRTAEHMVAQHLAKKFVAVAV